MNKQNLKVNFQESRHLNQLVKNCYENASLFRPKSVKRDVKSNDAPDESLPCGLLEKEKESSGGDFIWQTAKAF